MIGVLLAGGSGRRIGGGKAARTLGGRALGSYPAAALAAVCERVAVVCKADTELPALPGVERWDEPEHPRHPQVGIVHALERAGGPVLVCGVDMPFVTADACRSVLIAAGGGGGAAAAVASAGGVLQPVLGVYSPAALPALRTAAPDAPLTETVAALNPVRVALPPRLVAGVNTPEELAAAEAALAG
jgi:molybdopterin-guanine dinucleotide biosynthesis protein A